MDSIHFLIAMFIGSKVYAQQFVFVGFDLQLWFQTTCFPLLVFIHKPKASSSFVFHKSIGMSVINIEATNVFFNLITVDTQLMNKGVPWRGSKENDSTSFQVFIEILTKHVVMVLDAYASTRDCTSGISIIPIWEHIYFIFEHC